MFGTFSKKTLLMAASLAVVTAGGIATVSAAPWDHHNDRRIEDHRGHDRFTHHDNRLERRHFVDRIRLNESLRLHHYRVIGDPYFVRDRYVVRTHNRFGHVVFVQVDPYSGAFLGEIRL